jgi:hypothetical protein
MESEKVFTGTSPAKIDWGQKEILWVIAIWVVFIVISYRESSIIPIVILAVFSLISLIVRLPVFQDKTFIKISDGMLSIEKKYAVLWASQLKDIVSIELEESRKTIPVFSHKALLIRNNKEDSYFLPLDDVTFNGMEPVELVVELNKLRKRV